MCRHLTTVRNSNEDRMKTKQTKKKSNIKCILKREAFKVLQQCWAACLCANLMYTDKKKGTLKCVSLDNYSRNC